MKRLISIVLVALFLASGLAFAEHKGKILVATKEKSPEAAVSDKAGLAPYFLFFDEKGNLVEIIDNPFKDKKEAGKLMLGFLVEKGVTAIVGRDYCGDIIGMLKDRGITAYNFEGSAAEAAKKVAEGKVLAALKENALVANHKAVVAKHMAGKAEIIAVAANGQTPDAPVSAQAGGAAFFLIFDNKGKLIETLANPEKNAITPGPAVVNFLAGKRATVVVAEGFGPKIVEVMKGKGIKAVAFKGSVEEAVKKFLQSI
ncbi:MAG: NifB/NifX family molybdenum-iron cluster-binding protein [Syntrophaceae bacterium]